MRYRGVPRRLYGRWNHCRYCEHAPGFRVPQGRHRRGNICGQSHGGVYLFHHSGPASSVLDQIVVWDHGTFGGAERLTFVGCQVAICGRHEWYIIWCRWRCWWWEEEKRRCFTCEKKTITNFYFIFKVFFRGRRCAGNPPAPYTPPGIKARFYVHVIR